MLEDYLTLFFTILAIVMAIFYVVINLGVTYHYTKEWVSGELYDSFNTRTEVALGFFIMLFFACALIVYYYLRNWYENYGKDNKN